ncbi:hypothetical protein P153DRAFT_347241 [Dothidotthia symphoricarpi CBS 119687]|uniref:RING-type domain-containing protein n=1 Tax=Dothidotthia symphoricarpi CBS 119687 TaxID=1392245 RepID=A0A6A6A3S8_9PLEO|nr:uncharacterized protein P153DRAFT_347241 [Dothidotthia symphoricarpi CBS 119687]KAF2126206.1 hypothetical protein P153DRAFT_347241 [Dothidotthia symphoricarpi CBS 119687]
MGTLTADCPRLDAHCPHKLATSCRLTSTLNCCACADERAHSMTYRVYIDGVGFVQRGTRWQGYCWFCKEFWTNRLAATDPPLNISQTRVPEIPDQTEFLERWFEFHQGYRLVQRPDGTEQRISVMGEPLKDVSPGFLPRTLAQMREGMRNDARRSENRLTRRRLSSENEASQPQQPHQSIEDALDSLLDEVSDDEAPTPVPASVPAPAPAPAGPQTPEILPSLQILPSIDPRAILRRNAEQTRRAGERFTRLFGTREEIQQDDYESPLSTMYNRAWGRFRQAEELRATGDNTAPSLEGRPVEERREIEEQLLWSVMRESQNASLGVEGAEGNVWSYTPTDANSSAETSYQRTRLRINELAESLRFAPPAMPAPNVTTPASSSNPMSQVRSSLQQIQYELNRLRAASDRDLFVSEAGEALRLPRPFEPIPVRTLDNQPGRPPPMTDEAMTKVLACQVCYQQLADIAVLPCGHMVMCQWCADVVIPVKHSHVPIRPSKCPMCRKMVKQRFKIHTG